MKNLFGIALLLVLFASCKKEYVCVCTNTTTGEKTYGDKVKTGRIAKTAYEESCEANGDVYNDVSCKLE
ncbi:MAG: hypothetical protein K0Q95_2081 [Bacteroidota bacterium]|jgi:hypothetical protein|nr:hypothetical protein [Bacteroidota bacterium]